MHTEIWWVRGHYEDSYEWEDNINMDIRETGLNGLDSSALGWGLVKFVCS
jgi:hypothetical protein